MSSMGSTGEPDRKRRHFSSISPTAAGAKKQQFVPISEDKKLDAAVLQFQNQKLLQKLESQKAEYNFTEYKLSELKKRQKPFDNTLSVVNESWEKLIDDLESCSIHTKERAKSTESRILNVQEEAFLKRILETGATECSSRNNFSNQIDEDKRTSCEKTSNIIQNIVTAIDDLWHMKEELVSTALTAFPDDGLCSRKISSDLEAEVKKLRITLSDLHLKHRLSAQEIQKHSDADAKTKAEVKRLRGELESTVAELEESNKKLAAIKSERDTTKGAFFPNLNMESKYVSGDKMGDKQKEMRDMECVLKDLLDQASLRASQLKALHEERVGILQQLSKLQNTLKSVKYISSSQAYVLVRDQLAKSKADIANYQALLEKLQFEKETLTWREQEVNFKNDLADVSRRSSAVKDCKLNELGMEIQRQLEQKRMIEIKLEEASIEPGRKDVIAEFKELLSSFPENMGSMQRQLSEYKVTASDVHSLRAEVQSLSSVLDRKVNEIKTLSASSANYTAELKKLHDMAQELKESDQELRLILEMYRRESIDPRDIFEARDSEYRAWALVQSRKSFLDEHSLELRVKTANEGEATAQQRLATAEAEIANLRQKLEPLKRDISKLSDDLKSKHEENEAYLSEIESIGQAYDDMQTQNQQLLQQITERDDYNIKLVLEGLTAKQIHDALFVERNIMENEIQQGNGSLYLYDMKASRIENQFNMCMDQVQKLTGEKAQLSSTLENTQKKLSDINKLANQAREFLEEIQSDLEKNRPSLADLKIELEKERFERKRIEEDLEIARRKVSRVKAHIDEYPIIEKLREELREYKDVLKCSICLERPKEVVITKCYHLFCNVCVQKIVKSRHRKCPTCTSSFGANDIKHVYI